MPPDSTSFFQLFLDPYQWTPATIAAFVSALAALASMVFAFWPIWQQRRKQRLLEHSFGLELYGVETIERSIRYYVLPNCSSVDPAQEAEIRQVVATEEELFKAVNKYLAKDPTHRHLLLLADFGMGKSSFVLNYYAHNQLLPKRKRQRLAVVPLGIPDADDYIAKIEDKANTVIFLDAFDEDTKAITNHRERLLELMQACRQFNRVLITCRTQFFPRDEEIPRETGISRVGSRKLGEKCVYEFWKLYLSPLNDEQVDIFLRRRYPYWPWGKRKRARELVKKIPLLSVRPMLLSYIPDLLESDEKINYAFQLYEVLVEKWLERESPWADKGALCAFSEHLAVDLYVNRQARGAERISRSELGGLAKYWNIPLDEWQLTSRSLLNRDAVGNYKFAHRSIMEYLFVKRFVNDAIGQQKISWTDQMKLFLLEMLQYYWDTNYSFPFDISCADLSDIDILQPKAIFDLSSSARILKQNEVIQMLNKIGFDSNLHKISPGLFHLYEVREIEGVKIVIDYATRLMWQQSGSSNWMTWEEAEDYIKQLNRECYAGYSDWRLPSIEELASLLEYTMKSRYYLYIDPLFDTKQTRCWSANKASSRTAWYADFQLCGVGYYLFRSRTFVRAVHSIQ